MRRVDSETKRARGTERADRVSVVPRLQTVAALPCPDWLEADGRECWRRVTAAMAARGDLAPLYSIELEGLCFWYERFHGLRRRLAAAEDPADKALSIRVAEANREVHARTAKLGLNPTDAGKVAIPPGATEQDEELTRLLGFDPNRAH